VKTLLLSVGYVAAAAGANLLAAEFGAAIVPFTAFVLIGFVMTTRDALHDAWQGRQLTLRLGLLIALGSLVSYLINADAARIAIASATAFAASETVNAIVYQPMLRRGVPWMVRVNTGNVPNAVTDSVLFVSLAFGFLWWVIAAQVLAKVAGGFVWSVVIGRWRGDLPLRRDSVSARASANRVDGDASHG
jgi:queuosine precursor transporter